MFKDMIDSDFTWYEIILTIVACIICLIVIFPIIIIVLLWYGIKKMFSSLIKALRDWAFDSEQQHTL